MRIAIGADHAGFELKSPIVEFLHAIGHIAVDVGTHSSAPVDYPDVSRKVAEAMQQGHAELGILICGSGVGTSVAANKFAGIRAAVCHDTFSAHQGREDDDVNVLCLGGRVIGRALALEIVRTWLEAEFSGLERHQRRLDKVIAIEKENGLAPAGNTRTR
ncbi:MAG: ribose 5-phosphate isomerase B [Acidobacteria bacterium]|nr:ribose 5-phosphate isomerase B [Acidobacteriota bacterium]